MYVGQDVFVGRYALRGLLRNGPRYDSERRRYGKVKADDVEGILSKYSAKESKNNG